VYIRFQYISHKWTREGKQLTRTVTHMKKEFEILFGRSIKFPNQMRNMFYSW